ncbi:MAG TPA: DinB family protein [Candidatus Sulfotelmatobacter sp.]|nr:DinB family protein [Candidatus Sulfotelmatobacter sp.]
MEALSNSAISLAERSRASAELEASRDEFLRATKGLSAAQWGFQPSPERWSIADCCEHVAIVEARALKRIAAAVQQAPADPSERAQIKLADDAIVPSALSRTNRLQAPEALLPTRRETPDNFVQELLQLRSNTLAFVGSTQDNLRAHFLEHPLLGTLDTYQWVLLISGHMRRHAAQIEEIKSDPRFPKQ